MIEHTSFFTIRCDIPDCKDRFTAPNTDVFHDQGWETICVFEQDICLCPDHVQDLKGFFFNA